MDLLRYTDKRIYDFITTIHRLDKRLTGFPTPPVLRSRKTREEDLKESDYFTKNSHKNDEFYSSFYLLITKFSWKI